ncbi:hypothetical protein LVJ94_10865 [Pendulispora rubella]|uniref:Uncharacterized protein n=1 Tax=Pendulispora rubella TaxID=2741070 RepID=A0ABZ2L9X8_9BACT
MATTKKGGSKKAAAKGGDKPAGKAAGKSAGGKAAAAGKEAAGGKRKLGLRGAAPWAARHAAKHAAEARARAAEPPLPGSARATIRTPTGAEDIKQKIADLHNALQTIKGLRKNFNKSFYDIGIILKDIQSRKLYEAKGYGTFEAFLEREIDLGKITSLRLVRVVGVFIKEGALEHGVDRVLNALVALETATESSLDVNKGKAPPPPISTAALPLKPPGR